ncbi:G-protein coupled receptor moody [Elysia marginata]|uniref:G-protein coupled receptor moody n=1 Tax=Elysia marginata TaxID=1093978 RepID=A0AAV4FQH3_9GAST|nr:G-protein coupled receptor moody [Elysia marginata]
MTITAIAWNRYKLVVDSQMYHSIFTRRNLALVLALTWLVPLLFLQPAAFRVWGHFDFIPTMSSCNLDLDSSSQTFKIFLLIVRAAIPSGLIIYFYTSIYIATRASRMRLQRSSRGCNNNRNLDVDPGKEFISSESSLDTTPANSLTELQASVPARSREQKREMRLTRMMIAIFLVFVVSYFPCTISSAIDMTHILSKTFHMFCQTSIFLGSAINPMLYGFMNSQFRTAYYNIIMCSLIQQRQQRAGTTTTAANSPASSRRKRQTTGSVGDRSRKVRAAHPVPAYSLLHDKLSKTLALDGSGSPTKSPLSDKSNSPNFDVDNINTLKVAKLQSIKI